MTELVVTSRGIEDDLNRIKRAQANLGPFPGGFDIFELTRDTPNFDPIQAVLGRSPVTSLLQIASLIERDIGSPFTADARFVDGAATLFFVAGGYLVKVSRSGSFATVLVWLPRPNLKIPFSRGTRFIVSC